MRACDATNAQLIAALRRVAMVQGLCDSGHPELLIEAAKRIGTVRRRKVGVAKGRAQ